MRQKVPIIVRVKIRWWLLSSTHIAWWYKYTLINESSRGRIHPLEWVMVRLIRVRVHDNRHELRVVRSSILGPPDGVVLRVRSVELIGWWYFMPGLEVTRRVTRHWPSYQVSWMMITSWLQETPLDRRRWVRWRAVTLKIKKKSVQDDE